MPKASQNTPRGFSTLNEKPLHAALKAWYARPGDQCEAAVDGFVIDIVRGDLLIEIQTRNFAALKRKVIALAANHPVRLVYPIAREKWIVKLPEEGAGPPSRRKSPKRGTLLQIFEELVSFPSLLVSGNFSIDVLFIQEEEVRRHDAGRGWRRKGWITEERRLVQVMDVQRLETPEDVRTLIPATLAEPFTTADLAAATAQSRRLARKMVYCLREMGVLISVGKRGNAILYERRSATERAT
jgi:hypothetical protein